MITKHLIILCIIVLALETCGQKNQLIEQTSLVTDTIMDNYFHKNVIIENPYYPDGMEGINKIKEITGKEAALFAIKKLKERGITNVSICIVSWITAPLGGYLVDAKGIWKYKKEEYSIFRIGIRDGSDRTGNKYSPGEEFVFLAMCKDKAGNKIWYPSPGPDYEVKEGEEMPADMFAYEFLLRRQEFENLSSKFK